MHVWTCLHARATVLHFCQRRSFSVVRRGRLRLKAITASLRRHSRLHSTRHLLNSAMSRGWRGRPAHILVSIVSLLACVAVQSVNDHHAVRILLFGDSLTVRRMSHSAQETHTYNVNKQARHPPARPSRHRRATGTMGKAGIRTRRVSRRAATCGGRKQSH